MKDMRSMYAVIIVLCLSFGFSNSYEGPAQGQEDVSTYIVHVQEPADDDIDSWSRSFFPPSLISSSNQKERMVFTYRNVLTGFAAKLTSAEAKSMSEIEGVVSVRPEKRLSLHTTHTPSFLGLHQGLGLWKGSTLGKGVIIGVIDTGIFPDHPSFSDQGLPPPPAKWKGSCDFEGAVCNNKLIGAKNFVFGGSKAPIDEEGHGTHTSSTAAGNFVEGANVFGQANGTASGMAPLAHLAMYRVCNAGGCSESEILAAMDAAIDDGVDVLSLSLGGFTSPFYEDSIAIGAFAAVQKGIFVSCSAGNDGPLNTTLSNEAPWILTVAASNIDRTIKATAKLGNGAEYDGESLFQPANFFQSLLPLVYNSSASLCAPGSLSKSEVEGKVVVCERGGDIARIAKGQEVKDAGGAAMILVNDEPNAYSTLADAHVLPATHVSYAAGQKIKAYISTTSSPAATILFKGTIIGDRTAPAITSFSSRGPSYQSPGILKPDITGPGVSILAAWPFALDNSTHTKGNFNIVSGTSMSCPHLSGIAALLKSSHPDWSPAAIKSAIITTADVLNLGGKPIIDETLNAADIFALGSGHVNPLKAAYPGLIYDIAPDDYIPYLCGLGYTDSNIGIIVKKKVKCSQVSSIPEAQLNYPSFSIILGSTPQKYTRTLTNVGPGALYTCEVNAPEGVDVTVSPSDLTFSKAGETATYTVTFSAKAVTAGKLFSQGSLTWQSSAQNIVRSPIAVVFK